MKHKTGEQVENIDKTELDYLAERMLERVNLEYDEYITEVKKMPPEKIIDEAYTITIMNDFRSGLESITYSLGTEKLKAVMMLENPLWDLYNEWMKRDWTYNDDIHNTIMDVIDGQSAENADNSFEDDYDYDYEDEDEYEI